MLLLLCGSSHDVEQHICIKGKACSRALEHGMGSSCPNPFVGDIVPPRRRALWVQLMDFANGKRYVKHLIGVDVVVVFTEVAL